MEFGSSLGRPEDEKPRPWFYAWSLASRCFPRGATILSTGPNPFQNGRVGAALVTDKNETNLNMVVVNDSNSPRTVRLIVPKVQNPVTLQQYNYFDSDRVVDDQGLPVMKKTTDNVDLTVGLNLELPGRGVIFLITSGGIQQSSP